MASLNKFEDGATVNVCDLLPGDGRDLLPSVLTALLGQPLQIRNGDGQKLDDNGGVDIDLLEKGILSKCENGVKVLGNGNLTKKLTVNSFLLTCPR